MGSDNIKKSARRRRAEMPGLKWLLLMAVVAIFVVLLYPSLVTVRHQYRLGDIAERYIKAPQDFFIEDVEATAASQRQSVEAVLTVYDYDPRILAQTNAKVDQAFAEMRRVLADFDGQRQTETIAGLDQEISRQTLEQKRTNELWARKEAFETAMGIDISDGAYKLLISENFSADITERIAKILSEIQSNGVVANKEILVKEVDRGITLRNVANQTEKSVSALRQYYGPDQAKTMVRIVAEPLVKDMSYNLVNLIVDLCQQIVQPNLTLNRNETEKRKKEALAKVKPVMYQLKAGEMLVREGERIGADQLLKLEALNKQHGSTHIASTVLGAALMVAVFILVVHVLYFSNPRRRIMNTNRNLLFMSLILVMVFGIAKMSVFFTAVATTQLPFPITPPSILYAVPTAAGTMLVCIFLGFEISLYFALVCAVCISILLGNRVEIFVFFLINGAMGAYWIQHCRERKGFFTAGARLGLLNMVLATAVSIYLADTGGLKLTMDWLMGFSGGISSAIVTVGVAPLLEMAFRFTTDITLLELANLDRPILRRLMLEAPGTYHHSVVVGSLVEAAAAEIGANPLLAKVCGYYHDIGKVRKPLYFIENQKHGRNKHDKLAPSMSALILIAHVKDGIEIARQNKLGQMIIDTIEQHHGTSLITYFYNKACQIKGTEAVMIDDFRYPGPRPQTKETGLVMLADVVEAASRTLDNPTPARIQGLVNQLVNKIFTDGQLDECELTLKDLHSIAKSFNKILTGIHHHRIEYGDPATRETGKGKHGHIDRQSTERAPRENGNGATEGSGRLRRLGLP